ncbi:MAG: PhoH family protein [Pseudomonadota bacterium]|nr:PhoH family protein [Pseudomonadota bacterium]MDE3038243.1 PhoH family protein [Pseudomonadota bacterium]
MVFSDNALLPMLFGENDAHLAKIEKRFHVSASSRGNVLALTGGKAGVEAGKAVLESLYADLKKGGEVGAPQVDAAIRMLAGEDEGHTLFGGQEQVVIKTMKKAIKPYSLHQANYIRLLGANDLVFALGPAGTGKTYLAVAMAVSMFISGRAEKIILSRPAVEAGEKLGFLPGDLKEKVDPYLRPLYDALYDMIPGEKLLRHMENGEIEVAPLAFMRGRTFSNAFVILDEAQNTTPTQMKMFLTRMGEHSRMVVTGDLTQTDLPKDVKSGLGDAVRKVEAIEGIGVVRFTDADVVRHQLAAKIIQAYDEWDRKKRTPLRPEA